MVRFRKPAVASSDGPGDQIREVADSILATTESSEFLKDLLSSYIHTPSLRDCHNCGLVQPTEPCQMMCLTCKKGGATRLS